MKNDKKIKVLQDILEGQNKEIEELRRENEQLKNIICKNDNVINEGYEKAKQIQQDLELKMEICNSLIRDCVKMKNAYKKKLNELKVLGKRYKKELGKAGSRV